MKELEPKPLPEWYNWAINLDDPGYLIEKIVGADALNLVTGPPTRGCKTWWAILCNMVIASGKGVPGLVPTNGPVPIWMMELEGPSKFTARRFKWLEKGTGIEIAKLNNFFWNHKEPINLCDGACAEFIGNFVVENDIKMVTIDTFAQSFDGDENSSQAVGRAMRNLYAIRQAGASVMLIHHTRKPNKGENSDIDDEIRGSSGLAGAYDVHHGFRRRFDEQDWIDLYTRSNDDKEYQYKVVWDIDEKQECARINITERAEDLTEDDLKIYSKKTAHHHEYSIHELGTAWGVRDNLPLVVEHMVNAGRITPTGKNNKYRKAVTVEK